MQPFTVRFARANLVENLADLPFLDGDPEAILIVEYMGERAAEAEERAQAAAADLLRRGAAFAGMVAAAWSWSNLHDVVAVGFVVVVRIAPRVGIDGPIRALGEERELARFQPVRRRSIVGAVEELARTGNPLVAVLIVTCPCAFALATPVAAAIAALLLVLAGEKLHARRCRAAGVARGSCRRSGRSAGCKTPHPSCCAPRARRDRQGPARRASGPYRAGRSETD